MGFRSRLAFASVGLILNACASNVDLVEVPNASTGDGGIVTENGRDNNGDGYIDRLNDPVDVSNQTDPSGTNPGSSENPPASTTNPPGGSTTPPGGTTIPPNPCAPTRLKVETTELMPDAIHGANVVFLIDDSGSMADEFQKVVWELSSFIDRILAATDNNYRIGLVFDTQGDAVRGRTFYRDEARRQRLPAGNPFSDYLTNSRIKFWRQETWSTFADVAFMRVFAPLNYRQSLPDLIPVDRPNTNSGAAITAASCSLAGQYYRPRDNQSTYGRNTPGCWTANQHIGLASHFLPNSMLNIVTISDDDLNVQFDRANFSPTDPNKNAYPEVVSAMFSDLSHQLGTTVSYRYHSIVGPVGTAAIAGSPIEKDGIAHLALSKHSGGASFNLMQSDWTSLFQQLQEEIIFSEQRADLSCRPSDDLDVKFNGVLVDPENYLVFPSEKRIQILPGAFDGYPPNQAIEIKVTYYPSGN